MKPELDVPKSTIDATFDIFEFQAIPGLKVNLNKTEMFSL